jgi:hypothetical protein
MTTDRNEPLPATELETACREAWNRDPGLRAEFTSFEAFVAYEKAYRAGKVRIIGQRVQS